MGKTANSLLLALGFFILWGAVVFLVIAGFIFFADTNSFSANITRFNAHLSNLISDFVSLWRTEFSIQSFLKGMLPLLVPFFGYISIIIGIFLMIPPFKFLWNLIILIVTFINPNTYTYGDSKMTKKEFNKMLNFFNPKLGILLIILGSFLLWIS